MHKSSSMANEIFIQVIQEYIDWKKKMSEVQVLQQNGKFKICKTTRHTRTFAGSR